MLQQFSAEFFSIFYIQLYYNHLRCSCTGSRLGSKIISLQTVKSPGTDGINSIRLPELSDLLMEYIVEITMYRIAMGYIENRAVDLQPGWIILRDKLNILHAQDVRRNL